MTNNNNDPDKVSNGKRTARKGFPRRSDDQKSTMGALYAESGQTLQGSFSAVSKPNFASKYSFESSRRDLHNALLCTVLYSQIFVLKTAEIVTIKCL